MDKPAKLTDMIAQIGCAASDAFIIAETQEAIMLNLVNERDAAEAKLREVKALRDDMKKSLYPSRQGIIGALDAILTRSATTTPTESELAQGRAALSHDPDDEPTTPTASEPLKPCTKDPCSVCDEQE